MAYLLTAYASHTPVTRRMATLATGLPAAALTALDLHQLDFIKRGFASSYQFPLFRAFPSARS